MKISQPLTFALTGWMAGVLVTVGVGLYWPTVFPGIEQVQHYYGAGPNLYTIVALALLFASPGKKPRDLDPFQQAIQRVEPVHRTRNRRVGAGHAVGFHRCTRGVSGGST